MPSPFNFFGGQQGQNTNGVQPPEGNPDGIFVDGDGNPLPSDKPNQDDPADDQRVQGQDDDDSNDDGINVDGDESDASPFDQYLTEDDGLLGPRESPEQREERIQNLMTTMRDGIRGHRLPEAVANAENVDFNDASSRNQWIQSVQQDTMRATVNTLLPTIESLLTSAINTLGHHTNDRIQQFGQSNEQNTLLESSIPLVNSKAHSGMVKMIYKDALKRHKNDSGAAITAVRKQLVGMGLDPYNGQNQDQNSSTSNRSPNRRTQTGNDALDGFAPLPGSASSVRNKMRV